jgi:hypothetical protein
MNIGKSSEPVFTSSSPPRDQKLYVKKTLELNKYTEEIKNTGLIHTIDLHTQIESEKKRFFESYLHCNETIQGIAYPTLSFYVLCVLHYINKGGNEAQDAKTIQRRKPIDENVRLSLLRLDTIVRPYNKDKDNKDKKNEDENDIDRDISENKLNAMMRRQGQKFGTLILDLIMASKELLSDMESTARLYFWCLTSIHLRMSNKMIPRPVTVDTMITRLKNRLTIFFQENLLQYPLGFEFQGQYEKFVSKFMCPIGMHHNHYRLRGRKGLKDSLPSIYKTALTSSGLPFQIQNEHNDLLNDMALSHGIDVVRNVNHFAHDILCFYLFAYIFEQFEHKDFISLYVTSPLEYQLSIDRLRLISTDRDSPPIKMYRPRIIIVLGTIYFLCQGKWMILDNLVSAACLWCIMMKRIYNNRLEDGHDITSFLKRLDISIPTS